MIKSSGINPTRLCTTPCTYRIDYTLSSSELAESKFKVEYNCQSPNFGYDAYGTLVIQHNHPKRPNAASKAKLKICCQHFRQLLTHVDKYNVEEQTLLTEALEADLERLSPPAKCRIL